MADGTPIEWTDATWNPVTGCAVVSPGCTNCYAMRLAGTRMKHHPSRAGLTRDSKAGPVWTGAIRFNEGWLDQPLRWTAPRMIFVCAHGDLFAEGVTDDMLDQVFAVMALAPQHVFQVLTKRPERMREYLRKVQANPLRQTRLADLAVLRAQKNVSFSLPLPNVWLGVSVEDQRRADERIPVLLDTPAAVRWISAEPLLGPVDFGPWIPTCYECGASCGLRLAGMPKVERCTECGEECGPDTEPVFSEGCPKCSGELEPVCPDCGHYMVYQHPDTPNLDWIVAGGESGPGARPMHPDWARSIRDQCAAAGVPFLFKQWGNWAALRADDGSWPANAETMCRLLPDGTRHYDGWPMQRVGKKTAGRILDGVTHDGFPEIRP
jgi:protein gp37